MTERIGIWAMSQGEGGGEVATPLEELMTTETEQRLEDLLVASPDVLLDGLRLIGRQIQTSGGPLDLLGVDPDGRIALFELKRGTLTREAVAQLLDYASDLMERDDEGFASLIETSSGRLGIDRIDDFTEWFSTEYPEIGAPELADMRLVLVGLGVDERAIRVVNLLARSGLDVQLLTFQAFRRGDEVLLARRTESVEPKVSQGSTGSGTKAGNRRILEELAREQGVLELLIEVADFVSARLNGYRWPNQTAFAYSLNDVTEEGRATQRSYAALWVDQKQKGRVLFSLPERAIDAAGGTVGEIVGRVEEAQLTSSSWTPFELPIDRDSWTRLQPVLSDLIGAVVAGWQRRMAELSEGGDTPPIS